MRRTELRMKIIDCMRMHGGRLASAEIADAIQHDRELTRRAIKRMVDAELVKDGHHPKLTPAGFFLAGSFPPKES